MPLDSLMLLMHIFCNVRHIIVSSAIPLSPEFDGLIIVLYSAGLQLAAYLFPLAFFLQSSMQNTLQASLVVPHPGAALLPSLAFLRSFVAEGLRHHSLAL